MTHRQQIGKVNHPGGVGILKLNRSLIDKRHWIFTCLKGH
jgi:hypothetical protein